MPDREEAGSTYLVNPTAHKGVIAYMIKRFAFVLCVATTLLGACGGPDPAGEAPPESSVEALSALTNQPELVVEAVPELGSQPTAAPSAPGAEAVAVLPEKSAGIATSSPPVRKAAPATPKSDKATTTTVAVEPSKQKATPPKDAANSKATTLENDDADEPTIAAAPSHETFDKLLSRYVSRTGEVDYAGLKSQRSTLDAYLATLNANAPKDSWSRNERLAYWINAYNAGTIRLILDNYPLKSIQSLDGGKTWDVKRVELGGKTYSLNQIENDIIRPRFKEPRIHFAVNCAAKGCPPLRNEAFTAEKLERQLADQTKKFINDDRYTTVSGNTVTVSKIFDWYGADFADVKAFVAKYRDLPAGATLKFADYDWSLNKA